MGHDDEVLDRSYAACRRIAGRSGSNFYRSFSLLRPDRRRGMMALYAFARLVDDWGDENVLNPRPRSATAWHEWIDRCLDADRFASASTEDHGQGIRLAVADTIERFSIPTQYFHQLIEGVTMDLQRPFFIEDRSQLERYCYLVASTVGLACLHIWGADVDKVRDEAIACGRAFQLTNIVRDVREDSLRQRIYVPGDLFDQHSVRREAWLEGIPDGDWQGMLMELVDWARDDYGCGWHVHAALGLDGQRMFALMWHSYRKLLEHIANNLSLVWERQVSLNRWQKGMLFMRHAITPWQASRS
jgi:phytoene synthase